MTDEEIIKHFQNDDSSKELALNALIKAYQKKLYWHIRRMVADHEDADDILQQVFIKVWRKLGNFRGDSGLYTWLYRVATNESITFLNKEKKRRTASLTDEEGNLSNKLKADRHFDADKAEWKLQMAIQSLPDKQKAVFTLRYYDELPYDDISRILDTSVGALKASYHHAAKKVAAFLKKD